MNRCCVVGFSSSEYADGEPPIEVAASAERRPGSFGPVSMGEKTISDPPADLAIFERVLPVCGAR